MGRAVVSVEVDGNPVDLQMTIGALEEIAVTEPVMLVLFGALETGTATLQEIKAVLAAGLKAANASISVGDLIEAIGLEPARELACRAMREAFKAPEGKLEAALGQLALISIQRSSLAHAWGGDHGKPDVPPSQISEQPTEAG